MGATTMSFYATKAQDANYSTTYLASRPDLVGMVKTSSGPVSVTGALVSHEVNGASSTAQGIAAIGSASFDGGMAKLTIYGAYASGALMYLKADNVTVTSGLVDSGSDASNLSSGSSVQAQLDVPVGKGTFSVFGEQISAKQDTSSWSRNEYAVFYKHPVASGLWVRPELAQRTTSGVIANVAYLRIQRDF